MAEDTTFLEYFRETYPEFAKFSDDTITKQWDEILCLYAEVSGISKPCQQQIVGGYVVAHFLALAGDVNGVIAGGGAMLSSASVGGISISTNAPSVTDWYDYFFGSTPYGLKFLAYLSSVGGLYYVN